MRFADRTILLGPHRISPATLLAPMAAVSIPPFREACLAQGCGLATTEMVAARHLTVRRAWRKKKPFERAEGERVLHVQLFGNSPEVLAEGARAAVDFGADALDVNLGCPARKVVGSGSGAALGRDPATAARALAAITAAVAVPVTAKIRAGWDDQSVNLVEAARALADAGAAWISVHPRTRMQMFGGRADWTLIARVVEAVSIPVIGNGDVRSAADAERMVKDTGCAAVMVGRAALGRPWIFGALARGADGDPPVPERLDIFRRYVERYVAWAGAEKAIREVRKHLLWLVRGVPGAPAFRADAQRVRTPGEVSELLERARTTLSAAPSSAIPPGLL
ncbi:MAG: tRNA dihydrouridine synthase DusB [Deltaproteobacteria bacterium]|nr:tRNA dihydrouridine synthase DusB [Deltaproteobacteria bacterium]